MVVGSGDRLCNVNSFASEVRFKLACATNVARGAMKRSTERQEMPERYLHDVKTPVFESLNRGLFMRLADDAGLLTTPPRAKYDDVCASRPRACEVERVGRGQQRLLRHENIPSAEHGGQAVLLFFTLVREPGGVVTGDAWAVRSMNVKSY